MKKLFLILLVSIVNTCFASENNNSIKFDDYFINKSLRIDFNLEGSSEFQKASLIQFREEPVWGGVRKNLIDNFHYGDYFVKVYDKDTKTLIYSRGFNTLFEEWRYTQQAKTQTQKWLNSVVIPFPKNVVNIQLLARNKSNMEFEILWEAELNPKSENISRSKLKHNKINKILNNGDPAKKVDLVFIGDGYSESEQAKFKADAFRFAKALFTFKPFAKHKEDFNIWTINIESKVSGTSMPDKGINKGTALASSFNTFGVPRYLTCQNMKPIRDAVWETPCDLIFILVNTERYGGAGMYNLYAMGAANNEKTLEVFVHELGHSFAGLADEYEYGDVMNNLKYEPWEPNITTLVDFKNAKKLWYNKLEKGTPIPTPLDNIYQNKVGVFEGAAYVSKGMYRPMNHCMMRDLKEFCPVCQDAIVRMINYFCDKNY